MRSGGNLWGGLSLLERNIGRKRMMNICHLNLVILGNVLLTKKGKFWEVWAFKVGFQFLWNRTHHPKLCQGAVVCFFGGPWFGYR